MNPGVVPDHATWALHVDLETLLDSSFGQMVMSEAQGEMEIEELEHYGIDPFQDLFGFTAYGEGEDERSIVAIVEGADMLRNIVEKLEEEAGDAYTRIRSGGRTVHAIEDGEDSIYAVFEERRRGRTQLVLSTSLDRLDAGVQQLGDHDVPGFIEGREPRAGSFLYVVAEELPGSSPRHPASELLQNASGLMLEIGEHRGGMFIDASLETGDAEQANMLLQAVRGVQAMAGMMASQDPELERFVHVINNLNLNVRGDLVSASLQIEMGTIEELMAETRDQHREHGADEAHDDHDEWQDEDEPADDRLRELERQIERLERMLERLRREDG